MRSDSSSTGGSRLEDMSLVASAVGRPPGPQRLIYVTFIPALGSHRKGVTYTPNSTEWEPQGLRTAKILCLFLSPSLSSGQWSFPEASIHRLNAEWMMSESRCLLRCHLRNRSSVQPGHSSRHTLLCLGTESWFFPQIKPDHINRQAAFCYIDIH